MKSSITIVIIGLVLVLFSDVATERLRRGVRPHRSQLRLRGDNIRKSGMLDGLQGILRNGESASIGVPNRVVYMKERRPRQGLPRGARGGRAHEPYPGGFFVGNRYYSYMDPQTRSGIRNGHNAVSGERRKSFARRW